MNSSIKFCFPSIISGKGNEKDIFGGTRYFICSPKESTPIDFNLFDKYDSHIVETLEDIKKKYQLHTVKRMILTKSNDFDGASYSLAYLLSGIHKYLDTNDSFWEKFSDKEVWFTGNIKNSKNSSEIREVGTEGFKVKLLGFIEEDINAKLFFVPQVNFGINGTLETILKEDIKNGEVNTANVVVKTLDEFKKGLENGKFKNEKVIISLSAYDLDDLIKLLFNTEDVLNSEYAGVKSRKYFSNIAFTILLLFPWVLVWFLTPSQSEIVTNGCVNAGTVKTKNNNDVDVYISWGDITSPRKIRNDIAADIVGIGFYFDPVDIDGKSVLFNNPVLNNVLYKLSYSETEIDHFISNLIQSLDKSRDAAMCFMSLNKRNLCSGNQIIPYLFEVYEKSVLMKKQGVKQFALLPLFDPKAADLNNESYKIRNALSENTTHSIKELIELASNKPYYSSVRTIMFPIIGSTSHSDDLDTFMDFNQGVFSIVKGVLKSSSRDNIDRVYIVAFNRHTGIFKKEALSALQNLKKYIIFQDGISGKLSILFFLLITLISMISFYYYNRKQKIDSRFLITSVIFTILIGLSFGINALVTSSLYSVFAGQYSINIPAKYMSYLPNFSLILYTMTTALLIMRGRKVIKQL